jgi:hypothetical protein
MDKLTPQREAPSPAPFAGQGSNAQRGHGVTMRHADGLSCPCCGEYLGLDGGAFSGPCGSCGEYVVLHPEHGKPARSAGEQGAFRTVDGKLLLRGWVP